MILFAISLHTLFFVMLCDLLLHCYLVNISDSICWEKLSNLKCMATG